MRCHSHSLLRKNTNATLFGLPVRIIKKEIKKNSGRYNKDNNSNLRYFHCTRKAYFVTLYHNNNNKSDNTNDSSVLIFPFNNNNKSRKISRFLIQPKKISKIIFFSVYTHFIIASNICMCVCACSMPYSRFPDNEKLKKVFYVKIILDMFNL